MDTHTQIQTWSWSCTSASGAASCAAGCDDVDAYPRRTLCQIALLRFGNSIRCFWIQGLPGVPELLQMGTPIKWERPFIVKLGMCNLPPDGGKLHRLFHSSMPKFSVTPIHRKTWEVQFAAGGLQIAQTFPLIGFWVSTLLDLLEKKEQRTPEVS